MEKPMRKIPCNRQGYRIGEGHHNCRWPDYLVAEVLRLYREEGLGYVKLSRMLCVSPNTIKKFLTGERRGQFPAN